MATIKTTDNDVKLFTATDQYYYVVDNRPLRELLTNIQAINDQVTDIYNKSTYEVATFYTEAVAVGAIGGVYKAKNGGIVERVTISHGTAGSGGTHTADVNINGTTVFTTQTNRPSLDYNDVDSIAESGTVQAGTVVQNDLITCDLDVIQAGTPVVVRIDVHINTTIVNPDAASY